jgi:hypothetical protein
MYGNLNLGDWNQALEMTGSDYRVPDSYGGMGIQANPYDDEPHHSAPAPVSWHDYDANAPAPLVQNPTTINRPQPHQQQQGGGGMNLASMGKIGSAMNGGGGAGSISQAEQGQKNQQHAISTIGNVLGLVAKFYGGDYLGAASSMSSMKGGGKSGGGGGGGNQMLGMLGGLFGGGG